MILEKTFLQHYLEKFDLVPFVLQLPDGECTTIGKGKPEFELIVNRIPSKVDLMKSTSLALGEAYMNGDIEIKGDLYTVLNLFLAQMDFFVADSHSLKNILRPSSSMKHQKKEVQSHYDIGNDFYSLWLDDTLSYSCGYFKNENDTLYDAQMNKIHHSLSKLNLKEGMTLLDIGCGWGYLLIEAAKKYKTHGVGITLSEEQAKKFNQRIIDESLEQYLEVKIMDYRDLDKLGTHFDRIISVGMLEHVGRDHYDLFIKKVNHVLKDKGLFLLHYISALEEHDGDPWIKKYIFPGGTIPSLREMIDICSRYHFYTLDVESLRLHYVKTLLCWNENYQKKKDIVKEMFDEKFVRMWEMYLCSCAASFNNGTIDLHQILLSKGVNNELPLTRSYME